MSIYRTVSCTVTGYRKATAGKHCEDATRVLHTRDMTVLAVADGHGDSRCIFASVGAELAVQGACTVLKAYGKAIGATDPAHYWNSRRTDIARDMAKTFAELVLRDYATRCPGRFREGEQEMLIGFLPEWYTGERLTCSPDEIRALYARRQHLGDRVRQILYLYGTTLRASVLTETYLFNLAIGDGDTLLLTPEETLWVLPASEAFGTETASLCESPDRLIGDFVFSFLLLSNGEADALYSGECLHMLVLSTDGLRNSFFSNGRFCRKLEQMYGHIQKKGAASLSAGLKQTLSGWSRDSVFQDDISVILAVKRPQNS